MDNLAYLILIIFGVFSGWLLGAGIRRVSSGYAGKGTIVSGLITSAIAVSAGYSLFKTDQSLLFLVELVVLSVTCCVVWFAPHAFFERLIDFVEMVREPEFKLPIGGAACAVIGGVVVVNNLGQGLSLPLLLGIGLGGAGLLVLAYVLVRILLALEM